MADYLMDPIQQIVHEMEKEIQEARAKYEPIVMKLSDASFIAILQVVDEERQRRMVRLMLENPAIMQMEVEKLNQMFKDEGN